MNPHSRPVNILADIANLQALIDKAAVQTAEYARARGLCMICLGQHQAAQCSQVRAVLSIRRG